MIFILEAETPRLPKEEIRMAYLVRFNLMSERPRDRNVNVRLPAPNEIEECPYCEERPKSFLTTFSYDHKSTNGYLRVPQICADCGFVLKIESKFIGQKTLNEMEEYCRKIFGDTPFDDYKRKNHTGYVQSKNPSGKLVRLRQNILNRIMDEYPIEDD